MANQQGSGRGSNLSQDARKKGGEHSHGGQSKSSSSNLSKSAKAKGGKHSHEGRSK
ncbi:hypothetical protein ACNVED_02275 [Legionella sp. D16C41]|uniref:hypothetical protein n=1 Tax=Legionella sp. D16C41 TaxID=3402688 RepID=UPI003AF89F96